MSTQIELLKKYGLSVRGHLGQHLLIDPNIQRKIVDALEPSPEDRILEIGPGLGALTEEMLKRGSRVWAVEKDKNFAEILQGELGPDYKDRLTILNKDILEVKFDKICPRKSKIKWKIISNLPYYITAPILFHVMEYRAIVSKAVFTMQKEVASRLNATPGTKDYGRLTLAVRYAADVRYLFDIARTCFTPQPEVDSSVVELTFHPDSKLPKGVDKEFLFELIRCAFSSRRKTFLHLLIRNPAVGLERAELVRLLARLGLDEKVRGEALLLKDFMALAAALKEKHSR